MSIVEQFGPAALAWLRKSAAVADTFERTPPAPVSFASVEYELSQLRSSLDGVVAFPDRKASTRVVAADVAWASGIGGIERRHGIRSRLVTLA